MRAEVRCSIYMGLLPMPMEMSLRTINGVAVGELGTHGVFMMSCDGRKFDEQQ